MNKIDLDGRCAVVTGGAQGFGRAITERFVSSGAKVAIWDHDQPFAEKTAKEIGSGVTAFKVDVSDLAAVEKVTDATLKAFGKIDILINNAGIAARAFERIFQLADFVVVKSASLENGLLHVDLVREIPEAKKPRNIPISTSAQAAQVVDGSARKAAA